MAARSVLDDNKRLVTEFYELAINQQNQPKPLVNTSIFPIGSTIRKWSMGPTALFNSLARCKRSIRS